MARNHSVEKARRLADRFDRGVVRVLRRNELGPPENAEDRRIVDRQQHRARLIGEAGPEGRVPVAPEGPLGVGKGGLSQIADTWAGSTFPALESKSHTE